MDVIRELDELGIKTIYEIPEHVENSICVVRSHGEAPEVFNKLEKAELSLQMAVQIRNRILNAYTEINNMAL